MPSPDMLAVVERVAKSHSLPPALVCAVIEQESGWDQNALRYEPAFYTRYLDKNLALNATEKRARAFSWGLMQVMGEVAREHGYTGPFPYLCASPQTAIEVGCTVLSAKLRAEGGDVHEGLQAWNGGGNPNYASAVLARVSKYEAFFTHPDSRNIPS